MEDTSRKVINKPSSPGPVYSPFLTIQTDGDKEDAAMDMMDAKVPRGDGYASQQSSASDDEPDEEAGLDAEDGNKDDAGEDAAAHDGHEVLPGATTASGGDGVQALRRSKRKPEQKLIWWERNQKAYVAGGPLLALNLPGT